MTYFLLLVGFVLLVKGADYFVSGASGVAKKLRVPSLLIGLTIVAFGTSAPEAAVSISAAIKGNNGIAVGNKPGEVPQKLKLIILTHGDSDHAGNCKFLRENYGAKIAMHFEDSMMVEEGDMTWNRKSKPDRMSFTFRLATLAFGKNSDFDTFKPDIYLKDGQNLAEVGLSAKIIHLPGHSKGSIGVLTDEGDLFCGDLIYNLAGFSYIDNLDDFNESINKLKKLDISIFYPGHGKPFDIGYFNKKFIITSKNTPSS